MRIEGEHVRVRRVVAPRWVGVGVWEFSNGVIDGRRRGGQILGRREWPGVEMGVGDGE